MKLEDLVNSFTPDEFHDDPRGRKDKNGKPLQVLKDPSAVYKKLRSYDIPFKWEPVTAGFTSQGKAFFAGKLTLVLEGKEYTFSGTADEDHIGLSGADTIALQNALLRKAGAAEYLYDGLDMPEPVTPPQNASQAPATPIPQAPPAQAAPQKKQWNRPRTLKSDTPARPKASGPPQTTDWTGEELITFGKKYQGVPWNQVPNDYLQFITSGDKPNQKAQLEINRRMLQNPPDLNVDGDAPW